MTASRIFRAIGCPGAGLPRKTTWLSTQSQIAAAKHGGSAVQIVSLTKTAAAEIGARDTSIPAENCSTLHAACYRALDAPELAETRASLREFAQAHPEYAGDDAHDADLDDDVIGDAGGSFHAACQNHRARMTPRDKWSADEQAYGAAWDDFCAKTNRMDFTSLIETCLRENVQPVTHPRVLLADEAQDMSSLEFALVVAWSRATDTTVVVGDESQALYGWRGSDVGGMGALDVTGERVLKQSYRCSAAVRNLAIDWLRQSGQRVIDWRPTERDGSVHQAPFALRDSSDLLDQINALDGTVMILTSCAYMLDSTLAALRAAGVAFGNPHRRKEKRWNPTHSAGYRALGAYLRTSPAVHGDAAGPRTWGDLHAWTSVVQSKGYLARGAKSSIEEHVRVDQFGVSRATETVPLAVLVDLLGSPMHPALRGDVQWFRTALMARHAKAGAYAAAVWEREPGALLAEPRCVVGTVHSVKGASSDHVLLCPELSKEGYFGEHGWHGDGADALRRMAYVGITRARESVHVLEPAVPECLPLYVDERGALAA